MARYGLGGSLLTLDDIDNFFSIKPVGSNAKDRETCLPHSRAMPAVVEKQNDRIKGRMIDEHGNPIGPEWVAATPRLHQRSRQGARYVRGTSYVSEFRDKLIREMEQEIGRMDLSDIEPVDQLETRSMTSLCTSTCDRLPSLSAKDRYKNFRYGVYDENLPITRHKEKIVNTIESTQCTIIQGMTGCGKTTQVPQYIIDHYALTGKPCKIAVTQPRRIAAISIARRVCSERGWIIGNECGYQVARDTKFSSEDTLITYMTTGVLLQKLINDKSLHPYTHVILDEVHERDQDTDLALLIVRKFIRSVSPQVKVILMSATFECDMFAEYFGDVVRNKTHNAPVINVEGKIHHVQEMYWSDQQLGSMVSIPRFEWTDPNVFPEAMVLAVKLLSEFDRIEQEEQRQTIASGMLPVRGTVLIFLPGLAEIQEMHSLIEREAHGDKLVILPLHSTITLEEQARVFESPHKLYRKVILSTNIAESSITVPDIKYVVDFCLTKNLCTDPDTNMTCLKLEWASKAQCKQRMGRAGRVSNGRSYKLVHRGFYMKSMLEYGEPEVKRCPLTQLILRVKKLASEEPRYLLSQALTPPDMEDIRKAILLLKEAGALADPVESERFNPYDGHITFVGNVLSSLPLSIELGKLLVFGYILGMLPECLIIAAALHTRSVFKQPFMKPLQSFSHKLRWDRGMHSDPMATVNAYKEWDRLDKQEYFMRARNAEDQWCNEYFLQKRVLHEVREVIADLQFRLEEHGISPSSTKMSAHLREDRQTDAKEENLLLKVTLACAFYPNYFTHKSLDPKEATKTLSGKSPLNTVYIKGFPNNQGVIYKRQVEQMIRQHIPNCNTNISFENTRGYVEFEHVQGDCGQVPNALYIALLLGQSRQHELQLTLYDDQQVLMMMHKLQEIQRDAALNQRRLATNRMFISGDQSQGLSAASMDGPSAVTYFVTHVVECGHIYCHSADEGNMRPLGYLQNQLNSNLRRFKPLMSPAVGSLCVAPYEGMLFRARIEAICDDVLEVFFVDYGNTEFVAVEEVYAISPEFHELPYQAIECKLAFIKPPNSCKDGKFSSTINMAFKRLTYDKHLICNIYSVDKGVVRLDKVLDASGELNMPLHDYLYANGLVEYGNESFTSQQNHKVRSKGEAQQESDWGLGLTEDMPDMKMTDRRLKLSGPFSPIELKFYTLTTIGSLKECKVGPNSVNIVAIDEHPEDKHDRLMVAASVSVSPSGQKLIARETTLMPHIPGLPALMCLMFAPSIQLRSDNERMFYTGALCGLGRDPTTMDSAFPEHDIEIEFDTDIDIQDINQINAIRMRFNYALGKGTTRINERMVLSFRQKLRSFILQLLQRERKSREKVFTDEKHVWTEQENVLETKLEGTAADEMHLYRLINPPYLESLEPEPAAEEVEQQRYLRMHCSMLHREAAVMNQRPFVIVCELCNVQIQNRQELRQHLDGRIHKRQEQTIYPQS